MTAARTAPLVLLAALLAACSGVTVEPGPATAPVPEVDAPTPPLPEEAARQRRPPEGIAGVYRLVQVGDSALPAPLETRGGCVVRAVRGTLSLEEGGFTFSGTTQEVCGATARPAVVHRAEGRYRRDGAAVRFTAGAGSAFGSATAQLLDEGTLQVTGVAAGERTRAVALRFRRDDPPR